MLSKDYTLHMERSMEMTQHRLSVWMRMLYRVVMCIASALYRMYILMARVYVVGFDSVANIELHAIVYTTVVYVVNS